MILSTLCLGGGKVAGERKRMRLGLPALSGRVYADAQIDDYHTCRGPHRLTNSPPRRLTVRARASHAAPIGTLGFGFWNDPFSPTAGLLAAPNCVWFFYASAPSDLALAQNMPGRGWKAATLRTPYIPPAALIPAAAVGVLLTRIPGLGRPLLNAARQVAQARETLLDDVPLSEWHTYVLEWHLEKAIFRVDGVERLCAPAPPVGPLGFVAWLDNQYAIVSRAGQLGFGLCAAAEEQWLEIENLEVE